MSDHAEPLRLLPFRAVRYAETDPVSLGRVLSPPYDVIDESQRVALEAADPHNMVRLILPREDGTAGDQYATAAKLFAAWLDAGVLAVDSEPALYVYEQRHNSVVTQRGIFGAVVIQSLDSGVILPHENVRKGPVEDRLALMRAMEGNPEPILLLYAGGGDATTLSAEATQREPLASFITPDSVEHALWAITDSITLAAIAADLADRQALIADGHHRYTTYGFLRDEYKATGRSSGPWNSGLALLVDESVSPPDIHAIHRAIPGLAFEESIDRASNAFRVRHLEAPTTTESALTLLAAHVGPAFLITDGTRFAILSEPDAEQLAAAKPGENGAAWWQLDSSIASVFLMERLWGISDAAGQVEAEHDPNAAVQLAVRTNGIALLLNPAPIEGIWAVARDGDAMPRKSTLFMPKPCSGVVMRLFRFEA